MRTAKEIVEHVAELPRVKFLTRTKPKNDKDRSLNIWTSCRLDTEGVELCRMYSDYYVMRDEVTPSFERKIYSETPLMHRRNLVVPKR